MSKKQNEVIDEFKLWLKANKELGKQIAKELERDSD